MRAEQQHRAIGNLQICFSVQEQELHLRLKQTSAASYQTTISQAQLPPSFTNIFDSIQDLAEFLRSADPSAFSRPALDQLVLQVPRIFGKSRPIVLPLTEKPQLSLESEVDRMKDQQLLLTRRVETMEEQIRRLERLFQEGYSKPSKARFDSIQVPRPHPLAPPPSLPPRPAEEEREGVAGRARGGGAGAGTGAAGWGERELRFEVDESNRFLADCFEREGNHIWKKRQDEDIYQVFSSVSVPEEGRHLVSFRVASVTDGMMWFGLITEAKRSEQYIGDEDDTIFISAQGSRSITLAGRKAENSLPPLHTNSLLGISVDIAARKIRFVINGERSQLGVRLPASMLGKKIYPFFQIFVSGDGVIINP